MTTEPDALAAAMEQIAELVDCYCPVPFKGAEAVCSGCRSLATIRTALDAAREREQEWEHRAEKAEAVMAYVAEQASERERRLDALLGDRERMGRLCGGDLIQWSEREEWEREEYRREGDHLAAALRAALDGK